MIKILLADDHEIVRSGLISFINALLPHAVIDQAWDGNTILEKIKEKDYALIIMDVIMPETNTLELIGKIIRGKPKANILIFTMNAEPAYAGRYLQAGARGYLGKDAPATELRNAITTVLKNKLYISPSFIESIIDIAGDKTKNPFDSLSSREFQIFQHLIKGKNSSDICNELNLKSSTVGTYKARIFEKLGRKNLIELIELAKMYNIILPY
ncbi:MAG: DNA-binding response regulator [Chitinophagaceae bacterium]|nr:DNA-binding response regulator [Chitinophagaceae bacterium]